VVVTRGFHRLASGNGHHSATRSFAIVRVGTEGRGNARVLLKIRGGDVIRMAFLSSGEQATK
jgi:hypothetical protein